MTDDELLGELLCLFESREEAEHVVRCDECDVHGDIEPGPYRCPENPVRAAELAEDALRDEAARVVWALIDFAVGVTQERALAFRMDKSWRTMLGFYADGLKRQIEVETPLFLRLAAAPAEVLSLETEDGGASWRGVRKT